MAKTRRQRGRDGARAPRARDAGRSEENARRSWSRLLVPALVAVAAIIGAGAVYRLARDRAAVEVKPTGPVQVTPTRGIDVDDIRNVVLISMDTTRWDVISAYGAPAVNTPHIAALAREGVVLENAYAPIPNTLGSHASMMTGETPMAHGVFDNGRYRLGPEHETLAEALRDHGFNTGAFVSALVLESRFGLDQGFDVYDDDIDEAALIGERRGDVTTARAIEWLRSHAGERNFLFLHLFDPHAPYEAPEPFASEIRRAYRDFPRFVQDYVAEIAFTDSCIGQLLAALEELGLYDRSLICVTADHGESHGDHGEYTHGFFVYPSTVKVPLVFKLPGSSRPLRVREPVEITDIPTTILGLLGLQLHSDVHGRDLGGLLDGRAGLYPDRALLGVSLEPRKYGGSALTSVIVGAYQYIQAPRPELYDIERDESARRNLIGVEVEIAESLRERLERALEGQGERALPGGLSVDPDTRQMLEQLGYVTAEPSTDETVAVALDPKDLIGYHQATLTAMAYVAPENHAKALAASEDMIRMRPDFYLGYLMKARVLEASGRHLEAVEALARARALAPPAQELTL